MLSLAIFHTIPEFDRHTHTD